MPLGLPTVVGEGSGKFPWIVDVTLVIAAAGTTITSASNTALVGGKLLSVICNGDSDAIVESVVFNDATGAVTITTATAQTAECTYTALVARANG